MKILGYRLIFEKRFAYCNDVIKATLKDPLKVLVGSLTIFRATRFK
jgi:hypothetical protein